MLIDDVLMSGRTVRAALNELFDYGRPASVTLVCLLDRTPVNCRYVERGRRHPGAGTE